ncbi:MAG: glycosyltransferase, partial [Cyanobacteriota bacterium]
MSSSKPSFQGRIAELPEVQVDPQQDWSTSSVSQLQFSLVIPTYNERHNLEILIEQLRQLLDRLLSHDYELIVVDDDSPDRTWEVAQRLADTYPQVR